MKELEVLKKMNKLNEMFMKILEIEKLTCVEIRNTERGYVSPVLDYNKIKNEKAKKLAKLWIKKRDRLYNTREKINGTKRQNNKG